eukprot:CAMPEP_0171202756 /NCGR_PEP_ID=MMETSP0790-20130122/25168_1 /TAXON_ID=2925 /ORGANISM="Alexandrium catenella, Strain OF101" /LENGTH=172 /DNA_ID=CAMNT_0011668193 /DNA_START=53 /DNA_END=572 /DNA_ORIENTATION=+
MVLPEQPASAGAAEGATMEDVYGKLAASPYPWPMYDIDGGRQSPFEDEDDYDYDSCCGPPLVYPSLITPGLASMDNVLHAGRDQGSIGLSESVQEPVSMSYSADPVLVDAVVLGTERLAGFKRRGRPMTSLSPSARRPRVAQNVPLNVPFNSGVEHRHRRHMMLGCRAALAT